jgi:hypothetical protein
MPRKYYAKYTRELLTEAAVNSISIADVLRYLEIPVTGGAHAHISRRLKQLGIDTSHFLGQAHMRNQPFRVATHPGAGSGGPLAGVRAPEAARLTPSTSGERRTVRLPSMWHQGRVERQADSIACGPYQRRLARQQEGESSLSVSELPLANPDIRR